MNQTVRVCLGLSFGMPFIISMWKMQCCVANVVCSND